MNTTHYLGFECDSIRKNSNKNQDLTKNFIWKQIPWRFYKMWRCILLVRQDLQVTFAHGPKVPVYVSE